MDRLKSKTLMALSGAGPVLLRSSLRCLTYHVGTGTEADPFRGQTIVRLLGELPGQTARQAKQSEADQEIMVTAAYMRAAWRLGVMRGRHRNHYSGVHLALVREVIACGLALNTASAEQLLLDGDARWGVNT